MKRSYIRSRSKKPRERKAGKLPLKGYKKVVELLTIAAGRRCENPWCRRKLFLDPHHIDKQSQSGADDPSNLVMLCRECHDRTDHDVNRGSWLGVEAQGHQVFTFSQHRRVFNAEKGIDQWETTHMLYRRAPSPLLIQLMSEMSPVKPSKAYQTPTSSS